MLKKISMGVLVLLVVTLVGCEANFSKGVNKDLLSGLKVDNDGLAYDEVYLTVDDERTSENMFDIGTEVYMNFTGVDYFEEVDGKVFPGAMMVVADKNGKEILEEDDMFAMYDEDGVLPEQASEMFVSLLIGDPMVEGEQYTWYSKIWDKVGDGTIEATMDIGVN
ncbi:hypothetical protein KJ855_03375 [Patescibacteria group bacterium]|nr:hypothetical protein [Patescibacteria group bacterium]